MALVSNDNEAITFKQTIVEYLNKEENQKELGGETAITFKERFMIFQFP